MAIKYFESASKLSSNYRFSNSVEELLALETALQYNPSHVHALYYLANFKYAQKCYAQALAAWGIPKYIFAELHSNILYT